MPYGVEEIRKQPTYALVCRRYAPFETFGVAFPFGGGRFHGDNRGPSTSMKDTSRVYQVVFFNKSGVVYEFAGSSGTYYDSILYGTISGHSDVKHHVTQLIADPPWVEFKADASGSNPLVPGAPDINTFLFALVEFRPNNKLWISCQVRGDNFPNLEVFLISPGSTNHTGATAMLIAGQTTGGRNFGPQTRLIGESRDYFLASRDLEISLDENGVFTQSYSVAPITLPG